MGWLFMSKYHMGGFHSPKAYLDAQCSYAPGSERTQGLRLLKSVWSGGEYYAAVQPYDETGAVEPVLAIVCLVRWNPKSTSGQHFGFKDMDEGMGPCEAKCPASVLDLLGPPRNEYAAEWRRRCRRRIALLQRPKPQTGDLLIFPEDIHFGDAYSCRRFRMVDNGRRAIFRGEGGGLYQIRRYMERDWTLVPTPRSAPSVGAGAAPCEP